MIQECHRPMIILDNEGEGGTLKQISVAAWWISACTYSGHYCLKNPFKNWGYNASCLYQAPLPQTCGASKFKQCIICMRYSLVRAARHTTEKGVRECSSEAHQQMSQYYLCWVMASASAILLIEPSCDWHGKTESSKSLQLFPSQIHILNVSTYFSVQPNLLDTLGISEQTIYTIDVGCIARDVRTLFDVLLCTILTAGKAKWLFEGWRWSGELLAPSAESGYLLSHEHC